MPQFTRLHIGLPEKCNLKIRKRKSWLPTPSLTPRLTIFTLQSLQQAVTNPSYLSANHLVDRIDSSS